jgi:serine/threonine protein kinase
MSDSMATKRPWLANWEELGPLAKEQHGDARGGHGKASLVKHRSGEPSRAVLKVLHRQDDAERRKRMYLEAATLEGLSYSRVPRWYDSNARDFRDSERHLFIVMEFIDGMTLNKMVEGSGVFPLAEAIGLVEELLSAVDYCQAHGVVHRDIKHDNIVLRGCSRTDPVLVDFGQSFNASEESGDRTATGQEIGNRFLRLPEHRAGDLKRDTRSDVTMCAGILQYVLTGIEPAILRDGHDLPPHERPEVAKHWARLDTQARAKLMTFLGRAFRPNISDRWPTPTDAREALSKILAPTTRTDGGARSKVLDAIDRSKAESDIAADRRRQIAGLSGDVLAAHLQPQVDLLRAELQARIAQKIPVHFRTGPISLREWLRLAWPQPESAQKVLSLLCSAPGLREFRIEVEAFFKPRLVDGNRWPKSTRFPWRSKSTSIAPGARTSSSCTCVTGD